MNTGHNSDAERNEFGSRINNLLDQRQTIDGDIKDLYIVAKNKGIDVKVLKKAVKLLREDDEKKEKRLELEAAAELCAEKLGTFIDTPLGKAAIENALRAG